ncbi:MAG: RICIN domain-containing protein, partial [Chloroflexota bacterium]
LLGGLLGSVGGGNNPLVKAALAGIAASAVSHALGGGASVGTAGAGVGYKIRNLASRKLLANPEGSRDNGTKIIQWEDDGRPEQAWQIERGVHGGTLIGNMASGKLLANPEGSHDNGTQIIQWENNGGPEQEWTLEPGPHGGVRIRNMASRKVLANPEGSANNGTNIIQWQDDGGPEQEWTFEPPLQ